MSELNYSSHYSVMLKDCLRIFEEHLKKEDKLLLADMTFGAGGHSLALAEAFLEAKVFAVDQDPEAYENGLKQIQLRGFGDRVELNHMNFAGFPQWFQENHHQKKLNGIILDLGVSSHHFDSFKRGFSFREDAPLDMRMNNQNDNVPTAAWVANNLSEEELANLIFEYGEEKFSRRIAKKIVEERSQEPLTTTKQLENICFHAYPANLRKKKTHPATRTFQAFRIFVNSELEALRDTLPKLYELLRPGGVLQVISFHSLEDRIVKRTFKEIFQTDQNTVKILTKRPLTPSENELEENPRSRSAKLRAIKRENPGGIDFGDKKKKNYKRRGRQ